MICVLPELVDGQSSIHTGLIWGLWGGREYTCLPSEGPVVELGVGHTLGVFRCFSLQLGENEDA